MKRVLLLAPATSYRAAAFIAAAEAIGVEIVYGSDGPNLLEAMLPENILPLDFARPELAALQASRFAKKTPIDAVIPADDHTAVLGAAIAEELGLVGSPIEAIRAARNKGVMRQRLREAGSPGPRFRLASLDDDPKRLANETIYPVVLKPTVLTASRGVIRADQPDAFVDATRKIAAILRAPDLRRTVASAPLAARELLIEEYMPGPEVAVEGILMGGVFETLAIFDKPDPLDGPYFEETIYVTPSRLPTVVQSAIVDRTVREARALGLKDGPVHAELRLVNGSPQTVEIAPRSIGGLCSRTLRFGTGLSLEELILRHALRLEIHSVERERAAAGVMMIPIPRAGLFTAGRGLAEARAVRGLEEIVVQARPGEPIVPLPEGNRYLGFLFARAETPDRVEAALREAHSRLTFEIRDDDLKKRII